MEKEVGTFYQTIFGEKCGLDGADGMDWAPLGAGGEEKEY